LRDTTDEGKDGKTVRVSLRRSPFKKKKKKEKEKRANHFFSCLGGLENFCFKMLEIT